MYFVVSALHSHLGVELSLHLHLVISLLSFCTYFSFPAPSELNAMALGINVESFIKLFLL